MQMSWGEFDKQQGADRAARAKMEWTLEADRWIKSQLPGTRFDADDLIEAIGTPTGVAVNANNAIGAVFLAAKNRRLVRSVGRVASRRRTNHGRFITVWERI